MAALDAEVTRVSAYVDEMRAKGRPAREFACSSSIDGLQDGLPVRVGPGANPGIILRGDTFVELGSPDAGSCAFVLWTDSPSLVRDGRVTLIGPDIQETPGASLPFGQILMTGGKDLGPEEHQSLWQAQYVADQVEGYMVKSSSRSMWTRVSKDAAAKGFSFETLGRSLMLIFRTSVPKVEAMEAVFITSSKEDVLLLDDIAATVQKVGSEIVKESWKSKGYDLDCSLDCSSCHDKEICDSIRDVIARRSKDRSDSDTAESA
jgi:CO dehydrogenase/acetyl-CoA synthase beta subunit